MKRYIWNLLIAIDQFFNALFGGDPDETISSRAGKKRESSEFADRLCKILDSVDKNHCEESIEEDEGDPT